MNRVSEFIKKEIPLQLKSCSILQSKMSLKGSPRRRLFRAAAKMAGAKSRKADPPIGLFRCLRQWYLQFDPSIYGKEVAQILALDQDGLRLIPLVSGQCSSSEAKAILQGSKASELFPRALSAEAALAGLWLYFSCIDECHQIVQNLHSSEAHFWHAILHRQEPDSGNSAYWFRRAGSHPIFRDLCRMADEVVARQPVAEFRTGGKWDPFSFIMFCERARQQPHSAQKQAAIEIQLAEWQLLFDFCARPKS